MPRPAVWVLTLLTSAAAFAAHPLDEAVAALNREDFAAAAPFLEQALEEDPDHIEARFNLAFAYSRLDRPADAIEQYKKLLVLKPEVPQALLNVAILELQTDQPAAAAEHLDVLLRLRPDDPDAAFYRAHALASAGDDASAVPAYEKALTLDPGRADAHLGLGRALARLGKLDAAEPSYRRAAEIDPAHARAQLELAEAFEQADQPGKALSVYRAYLAAHPDDESVNERVGLLTLDAGGGEEAIASLEAAVKRAPTSNNKAALAEAYSRAGYRDKAFVLWKEAVQADPGDVELRMTLANALLQEMLFEDAGGQYLAVSRIAPDNAEAWNGLAFCLYKVENYPAALDSLIESAKRKKPSAGNLYLRAIVEDKLMLFEEAKASYEAFLALKPPMEDEVWKSEQRLKTIEKILQKR